MDSGTLYLLLFFTFYGDFMVKFERSLSGNLICHVFSIKTPDILNNCHILWGQHNFSRCNILRK